MIVGIPSQPTNLTAVPGSTSINVSWISHEEDVIQNYVLQYSYSIRECDNSSDVVNVSVDDSENSHMLFPLEEDSDFNISLVAINPAGRSEAATVMVTTLTAGKSKVYKHQISSIYWYVFFMQFQLEHQQNLRIL